MRESMDMKPDSQQNARLFCRNLLFATRYGAIVRLLVGIAGSLLQAPMGIETTNRTQCLSATLFVAASNGASTTYVRTDADGSRRAGHNCRSLHRPVNRKRPEQPRSGLFARTSSIFIDGLLYLEPVGLFTSVARGLYIVVRSLDVRILRREQLLDGQR